jgi:hypothetical protein
MKTKASLLLSLAFCLLSYNLFPQSPQGFNYQAVVRNAAGTPLANNNTGFKFSILKGSATGTVVYSETFDLNTNAQGVVNLVVGTGIPVSGTFSTIDWSNGPYYLKVEMDPAGGTSYALTETKQLQSVPYALFSPGSGLWAKNGSNIYFNGGNVGIGTQTPYGLLHLKGTSPTNSVLYIEPSEWNSLGDYGELRLGDLYHYIRGEYAGGMTLYDINKIQLMGGNVGIGTNTPSGKLSVDPGTSWNDDAPLFEIKNNHGIPVFQVFNNGVRINVEHDYNKGSKSGFAVGGFNPVKGGTLTNELMRVTPDSIRFYINNTSTKGSKGGFAVGGYNPAKEANEDFMYITPQYSSAGFYNTFLGYQSGLNTTGGYNVLFGYQAGLTNSAGQYNVMMGYQAGYKINSNYNTFIGYQSGYNIETGDMNTYLGYRAGGNGTVGSGNVCIGVDAGYNLLSNNNVCIGNLAGKNSTGGANTYIGWQAGSGQASNDSYGNVFIGVNAGLYNKGYQNGMYILSYDAVLGMNISWPQYSGGSSNVCIGNYSGAVIQGTSNGLGNKNVCIGDRAGIHITTGSNNVFIGVNAGYGVQTGSGNVFLGTNAGYSAATSTSSKLYIVNYNTNEPLIFGDFAVRYVVIDGNAASNVNTRTFFVNGTAGGLSAWYNDSDKKLKRDIETIPDALQKVMGLRGVNFYWKNQEKGMGGKQMGFVGQEAAEVIPEVVSVKDNHYTMQYAPITALLVEAMKEQQKTIENQQKQIDELKSLVYKLAEK